MRAAATAIDLSAVQALVAEMRAGGQHEAAIDLAMSVIARLSNEVARLSLDNARLLRKHLGQTSERLSPNQLQLLLSLVDEAEREAAPPSPDDPVPPPVAELPAEEAGKTKKRGGRKPLPAHLPRVEIVHAVPDAERPCPHCGGERACIGHEQSEVLEFVPASFRVELHKREKLACKACEQGVTTAAAPPKLVDRGRAGPGLLAQVVVSKFVDHLPLNRQHKMFLRDGVDLPVSTLMDWIRDVHVALGLIRDRIGERVLAAHVAQADDTGIKVLDRDEPGGAKRGHLWCYVGDQTWSFMRYTPDWRKEGPQSYLAERRGWLVADAYRGYDGLYTRPGATAVEVACWAHSRRGFFEVAEAGDARAAVVLELIQRIYAVEAQASADRVDAGERRARRVRDSAPVVEQVGAFCTRVRESEPPASALAKAAGYVRNQWVALGRFLEDGALPVDNTLVERRLRPIAVGRNNYLFCGSDAGAERAATMYTVLGTCALVGAEPRAYLTDVLTKIARGWPRRRLDELLPPDWIKTAPESARVPPSR